MFLNTIDMFVTYVSDVIFFLMRHMCNLQRTKAENHFSLLWKCTFENNFPVNSNNYKEHMEF